MEIRRGDLLTIALAGDCGKPRPALVVQDDAFSALESTAILRLTSDVHDWPLFRITVEPTAANGLRQRSQVMIDKPAAVPRSKIGRRIGRIDAATLEAVDAALARFLGLSRP
ncbi:type II toxin-antitoxin system PemK/MazF family toxin [Mesorhizobium xinjiangense]|uniref:type II toxin-antitoxin system PemK/MazF family toxin n=1 Tax=Mesorhizobium xinjiangense TaxID=2678685 RepID=UPI0012ED3378|nr:type II toxin-antitoxin system PemK/MazF family toxin [Mesorhizobium xinjiangense]